MRRKKIAVLMAGIDREYQQDFAAALSAAGREHDMDICIFNSLGHMNVPIPASETAESMIYDLPDLADFDGVISLPATMGSEFAARKVYGVLAQTGKKPHISIDVPRQDSVTIRYDDRVSMEEMTEHLVTVHGVKRIAFISGPEGSHVSAERIEACRTVLGRYGLRLDDSMILDGQWTREGGRNAAETLLNSGCVLPDAIMCGNDDMALSVIECLNEHGIRVPEDIAVTGFDALREAVIRGLTTVRRPIDLSARKAVEILNEWTAGKAPDETIVTMQTIPVYGDSCGCARNPEHMNEKLRDLGADRWNMEKMLTRVSMFSGTMAGVGDERETYEKIDEFTENWQIHEFWLCVDPSICRDTGNREFSEGYPDEMLMLYGKRNGRQYSPVIIPRRELLPVIREDREDAVCLVFCPLYYRDRSLGYVAMELGSGTGRALYPVLMLLNGALMSLYLQTNIKRSAATIERLAVQDIMTGLLNRRGYTERVNGMISSARAAGKAFVMLSADMNHMKHINDRYGHLAGDEAICRMGRAMRCLERLSMIPVHISGDEFIACGMADDPGEAQDIIRIVKEELDRINREEPWICDISASFGVFAAVPGENDDQDFFMTMADRAMYADKNRLKFGRRKEDFMSRET